MTEKRLGRELSCAGAHDLPAVVNLRFPPGVSFSIPLRRMLEARAGIILRFAHDLLRSESSLPARGFPALHQQMGT